MTIEEMLDELETIGRRRTPRSMFETMLYYYGSIMLNKYRYRKEVGSIKFIRYFTIVIAGSGIGKDYSLKRVEQLFNLENYAGAMKSFYAQATQALPMQPEETEENLRYMPKSTTIGIEGTSEGLFQVCKAQAASGFGSLNLKSSELETIYMNSESSRDENKQMISTMITINSILLHSSFVWRHTSNNLSNCWEAIRAIRTTIYTKVVYEGLKILLIWKSAAKLLSENMEKVHRLSKDILGMNRVEYTQVSGSGRSVLSIILYNIWYNKYINNQIVKVIS